MLRSLAVVVFIGGVATAAIYVAQRPTIARGDVLAADLLKANAGTLTKMECDPEIPVGVDGARFACDATFASGKAQHLRFHMDRAGMIHPVDPPQADAPPALDKTDPWD